MSVIQVDLDSILGHLQGAEESAAQLIGGLSHAQANWQPIPGHGWSICQCIDHLARTNQMYGQAMLDAIGSCRDRGGRSTGIVAPGWFGRWFIASVEPPVKRKFRAPAKIRPTQGNGPQDVLREFISSHDEVRRILEYWGNVDFNRLRFRNPFVPLLRFTVGTGVLVITAHDRRHLWQAQRVKQVANFPKA